MSSQLALQIPKAFHPNIVGHGGNTIKQLQSTNSCDIHVPARDSPSSAVLLTGTPQAIDNAHRAIDALLGFRTSTEPLVTASFTLSSRCYGQLIGPGGQTLKSLESETGCDVSVPGRDSGSEVVSVQGNREGVDRALRRMHELTNQPINPSFNSSSSGSSTPAYTQQSIATAEQPSSSTSRGSGSSSSGSGWQAQLQAKAEKAGFGGLLSSVTTLIKDQLHIDNHPTPSSSSASSNPPPYSSSSQPTPQRQPSFTLPRVDLSSTGEINEVLFFPNDPTASPSSLDRFLQYLRSARSTVDSAIYTISDDRISRSLITLREQGVRVRVLTEKDTMDDQGSDVQQLANTGVEVRYDSSPTLMHHKFLIVDNRLLLNGSFNFTRSAIEGNQENVVITNHAPLVTQFAQHFERKLWPSGVVLNPGHA